MNKDFSRKRKQALKDWKYIQSNYGFCQSHDYDDERMWKLLENPSNEVALKILLEFIESIFRMGYVSPTELSNNLRQLPLTDKKIVPIKKRWIYGKEL
ncbi:hypothetical protein SH2C18_35030 [Clostridium sediminicola]|uniref:hypothetical protein n=1 Tax=Clostridium sediminicola TaxID=3114879 RepID=UPI0031F1EAFE